MRNTVIATLLAAMVSAPAFGASPQEEIQHLLSAIGSSGCTFIRNRKQHSASEAEAHLAMKYKRAGSRIKTAEVFIDRLASDSSWTGKPYVIQCADDSTPSRDWLTAELKKFRAESDQRTPQ